MKAELAGAYGDFEQWHWWFRGRQKILEAALDRDLRADQTRRVLSVGCGPAKGLTWLLRYSGPLGSVTGLDPEWLHALHQPAGVQFAIGLLPQAPLAGESFDVVLALDVLEHVDDDLAGLADVARLVKPGGLLVVTVPALPSLWGAQDVISEHRRRYTRRTLERLFTAAELSEARFTYFNTFLFPAIAAVRWTRRLLQGAPTANRSDFEDNRPGLVNDLMARLFGAEQHLIARTTLPIGVSLLATWRKPIAG